MDMWLIAHPSLPGIVRSRCRYPVGNRRSEGKFQGKVYPVMHAAYINNRYLHCGRNYRHRIFHNKICLEISSWGNVLGAGAKPQRTPNSPLPSYLGVGISIYDHNVKSRLPRSSQAHKENANEYPNRTTIASPSEAYIVFIDRLTRPVATLA